VRASVAPTPKRKGSPEASTQTRRPRSARTAAMPASNGFGQGRASPVTNGAASAR
jgi:hypothetical protein